MELGHTQLGLGDGPRPYHLRKPVHLIAGVLVVDKPLRLTSMDVVAVVRRRAGGARTGHAGTLDPLATGVLVVAVGRATKLVNRLMATTKRYTTEVDLAAFTDTDDLEGERQPVDVRSPPAMRSRWTTRRSTTSECRASSVAAARPLAAERSTATTICRTSSLATAITYRTT